MKMGGCVWMIESVLQTTANFRVLKDASSSPSISVWCPTWARLQIYQCHHCWLRNADT